MTLLGSTDITGAEARLRIRDTRQESALVTPMADVDLTNLRLEGEMANAHEDGNWLASTGSFTAALTGPLSAFDVGVP